VAAAAAGLSSRHRLANIVQTPQVLEGRVSSSSATPTNRSA
jgi:hypothetical protein